MDPQLDQSVGGGGNTISELIGFPEVPPGETVRVSASTYVAYTQCPGQAGARLEGLFGPESPASFRGALAHRLFARHLTEGPIDPESLDQVCRQEIGTALNPKMAALGLKPSTLRPLIEQARADYDKFRRLSHQGFEHAEVELVHEPRPGVLLRGSIDAVFSDDGGHRLTDWKTGPLKPEPAQLLFYALLWALTRGELPARVEVISLHSGERFEAVPSRRDVEEVAAGVAELVAIIRSHWETGERLARLGGPWCRYCPLLRECPEGTAVVELTG